jgi:hypothetical protein
MIFEYNAHLEYEKRIEQTAKEITSTYPEITIEEARTAALHMNKIDSKPTINQKFDRYYFILKTIRKRHKAYYNVLNDLYKLYKLGFNNQIYETIMNDIIDYSISETEIFPLISNYY